MTEFDPDMFQSLMAQASQAHNIRDFPNAIKYSSQASNIAPSNTLEKGRALRDIGAHYDRLGRYSIAKKYADEAYAIHEQILQGAAQQHPSREVYREHSVSAMYVGIYELRSAIRMKRERNLGEVPEGLASMRKILLDLALAKELAPYGINKKIDQYEINALRRISMAESLYGNKTLGRKQAIRAIGIAALSESVRLDTSNHNISRKERLKAKAKAFIGGLAAIGISCTTTDQNSWRRELSCNIARRTL